MTPLDWTVVIGGVAAIAWVNWYFFVAPAASPAAIARPTAGTTPDVRIIVDGGYDPAVIRVAAGAPVRLVFDRRDDSPCSEEVVFPDFGIRTFLPTGKRTTIELTPPRAGTYAFTCGMSMLHGTLIAEA